MPFKNGKKHLFPKVCMPVTLDKERFRFCGSNLVRSLHFKEPLNYNS